MADPTPARRLAPGATVTPHQFVAISGESVEVPDPGQMVHLELRRFAGCPICNLHLRSVVMRKDELAAAGIKEVVVFHSTDEELRKYQTELPLAVIADPEKKLYSEFGVERSPRAVLNPGAWPAIARGLGHSVSAVIRRKEKAPPVVHENGSLGLPGDFLIASDGHVIASKYGTHAFDQWTVDEVLALAGSQAAGNEAAKAAATPNAPISS
ncbi:MAG TPA: peroxiredoxin-like family protein [Solirubrobacteraceae bacterium]|nr:peroxiredoxin-like family protein [Solirubrobacteraceae bacterium]